jgi:hypothetical protein
MNVSQPVLLSNPPEARSPLALKVVEPSGGQLRSEMNAVGPASDNRKENCLGLCDCVLPSRWTRQATTGCDR